jgi:short chain dehydrogenase
VSQKLLGSMCGQDPPATKGPTYGRLGHVQLGRQNRTSDRGNRGIGFALTQGLAEAGALVAFLSRDEEQNRKAQQNLADQGLDMIGLAGDITTHAAEIVNEAINRLSGLDIVVNNAGICFHRPALEVPDEEWDIVFTGECDGVVASLQGGRRVPEGARRRHYRQHRLDFGHDR